MIELNKILPHQIIDAVTTVRLTIDERVRSRQKVKLDNDQTAGLFLPRGTLLRDGDLLSNQQNYIVKVIAADERVSTVKSDDLTLLARAAYHLGNRHVPLQVENGWLRYQHDHVLDAMLEQMGLYVEISSAPFEPEAGAYQQMMGGTHSHGHSHA